MSSEPEDLPLVHARGLVKRFGDFTAVDRIDVDVQRGEAFGFLGPNGAGRSSTMRMIGCVARSPRERCGCLASTRTPRVPASAGTSASCRTRTPSTRSSPCARTSWSTAATSACPVTSAPSGPTSCSTSCSSASAPTARSSRSPAA